MHVEEECAALSRKGKFKWNIRSLTSSIRADQLTKLKQFRSSLLTTFREYYETFWKGHVLLCMHLYFLQSEGEETEQSNSPKQCFLYPTMKLSELGNKCPLFRIKQDSNLFKAAFPSSPSQEIFNFTITPLILLRIANHIQISSAKCLFNCKEHTLQEAWPLLSNEE